VDQSFYDMRENLRSAIASGRFRSSDRLNDRGSDVAELFGIDSLDLVELVMAFENNGLKLNTIDDLMRSMDQVKAK
jgi:hypothetical protein